MEAHRSEGPCKVHLYETHHCLGLTAVGFHGLRDQYLIYPELISLLRNRIDGENKAHGPWPTSDVLKPFQGDSAWLTDK